MIEVILSWLVPTAYAAADPALVNAFTDVTTKTTDNATALIPVVGVLFALMVGISIAIMLVKKFKRG